MYYKRAKASKDFSKYKAQRNKVTAMLKEAKKEFFMKINPRNPKEFWKACKMLSWASTSIPALQMNGNVAKSHDEKAELLNTFFASCFNNSHSPLTDEDFLNIQCPDSFPEDFLCSEDQILDMLASLDVTKSSGPGNISARMLKATAVSLAPSIIALFNLSLQLGRIPQAWKGSRVVPIPKISAPKSPDNYRPISLLSVLSKVLERHVYNLIANHLEANPLSDSQWGFRFGRSTVSALLTVVDDWLRILEDGKEICAIFFDYRKAFDSVPHRPLMEKLFSLNLNPFLTRWISDYLTSRLQQVVVDGATSSAIQVLSGVPQGSVLGPLLFLI
jgi:hypothetical protein